jgi:hypothetical protein
MTGCILYLQNAWLRAYLASSFSLSFTFKSRSSFSGTLVHFEVPLFPILNVSLWQGSFLSLLVLLLHTLYLVTKYRSGYVRLINYAFDTWYTNESNWRVLKTKAIQQDNSTSRSCSNIQDRRNSYPMGNDSGTLRSSFFDTCWRGRYSHRSDSYPFRHFSMERI